MIVCAREKPKESERKVSAARENEDEQTHVLE